MSKNNFKINFNGIASLKEFSRPIKNKRIDLSRFNTFAYKFESDDRKVVELRFKKFDSSLEKLFKFHAKNVRIKISVEFDDSIADEQVTLLPYQN